MNTIEFTQNHKGWQCLLCFLMACFFFKTDLNAQTYPDLVPEALAQVILENEIPALENNLTGLTEGTPEFQLALRTYMMYAHTWEEISTGRNVANALTSAYGEFAVDINGNDLDQDELPILSKTGPDYGDSVFDNLVTALMQ